MSIAWVLPAHGRSVYIEVQGRAAGWLDARARRMVTALLLASSSATSRSLDATPVLPCDALAGRILYQPDAARPFRSCNRSQQTAWPFVREHASSGSFRFSQVLRSQHSPRSDRPGGELNRVCRETYAISSSSWWA